MTTQKQIRGQQLTGQPICKYQLLQLLQFDRSKEHCTFVLNIFALYKKMIHNYVHTVNSLIRTVLVMSKQFKDHFKKYSRNAKM